MSSNGGFLSRVWPWSSTSLYITIPLVAVVAIYVLSRHCLPKSINKYIFRLGFYPSLPFTSIWRRCRGTYFAQIDNFVYLGGVPVWGHMVNLKRANVKAVVNMMDEYSGSSSYKDLNIEQLHLPTVDHYEPSLEDMNTAIKFIESYVEKKEVVYIHCKSGHGRGAAIAFCWLVHKKHKAGEKVDLDQVQDQLSLAKLGDVRPTLKSQPNILAFWKQTTQGSSSSSSSSA